MSTFLLQVQLLNKMKRQSKTDNQELASLVDHKLTPEQIELLLSGEEALLTKENIDILSKGMLAASELHRKKMLDHFEKQSNRIRTLFEKKHG